MTRPGRDPGRIAAGRAHHEQAVDEGAEEHAERALAGAIADEAAEDARRELHRCERERDQQHRVDDRDHRHHRAGDRAEHRLRRAGIVGEVPAAAAPAGQDAGRLELDEHEAGDREPEGDQRRPQQHADGQVVGELAQAEAEARRRRRMVARRPARGGVSG
jgi:hypothetical protein